MSTETDRLRRNAARVEFSACRDESGGVGAGGWGEGGGVRKPGVWLMGCGGGVGVVFLFNGIC